MQIGIFAHVQDFNQHPYGNPTRYITSVYQETAGPKKSYFNKKYPRVISEEISPAITALKVPTGPYHM